MKKLIISGFAAAFLAGAPAAYAKAEAIHISYDDLDLTRKGDVEELNKRVHDAVETACETNRYVVTYAVDRRCMHDAMAEAKAQIQEHQAMALAMADQAGK